MAGSACQGGGGGAVPAGLGKVLVRLGLLVLTWMVAAGVADGEAGGGGSSPSRSASTVWRPWLHRMCTFLTLYYEHGRFLHRGIGPGRWVRLSRAAPAPWWNGRLSPIAG